MKTYKEFKEEFTPEVRKAARVAFEIFEESYDYGELYKSWVEGNTKLECDFKSGKLYVLHTDEWQECFIRVDVETKKTTNIYGCGKPMEWLA